MIDIHCHLLPGVDDGVVSLVDSLSIINDAIDNGFTDIIITPHYFVNRGYIVDNNEKLNIFKKLKVKGINLHLGNEVYISDDINELFNDKILCLGNSDYVLIEFNMHEFNQNWFNYLHEVQLLGKRIIIAHPERYSYFQEDINRLIPFLEKGILFQGNIGSLFDMYGSKAKKTLKLMMKCKMISFLATDTHRSSNYHLVSELAEDELLINNPKKVLNNEVIINDNYEVYKKRFVDMFL